MRSSAFLFVILFLAVQSPAATLVVADGRFRPPENNEEIPAPPDWATLQLRCLRSERLPPTAARFHELPASSVRLGDLFEIVLRDREGRRRPVDIVDYRA